MKRLVECSNCGRKILRNINSKISDITNMKFYCNMKCKSEYWKRNGIFKGSNNPNYGATYTKEEIEQRRKIAKDAYIKDPTLKERVGVNKGKKLPGTSEGIKKFNREHPGYRKQVAHHWSEDEKKEIGKKSSQKFTPEYKEKIRKIMENLGEWIPLNEKDDLDIYKKMSDWVDKMFDLITDSNQLKLLTERGVFNCRTNTKGVVRDHMYGRRSGYENKVFPQILRHPCNCQILTHSDNIAKKYTRYVDSDAITLDELFQRIECYSKPWIEQDLCISLIQRYRNGERWTNPYKVKQNENS